MKKILNYIAILLLGTTVLTTSCTNLDENIYDSLSPSNLTGSDEETQDILGNLYVQLRFMYWAWEGYFDINEESSDLIMTPYRTYGGWGAQYINLHQHTFYAGIPHLWQEWYYCNKGITEANQLLEVPTIQNNPEAKAEVRAIRALYYFILFDLWRNIPLETELNTEPGYLPLQVAPEHIWDFLVKEIEEAVPDMSTAKKYGRMNKYAGAMLAAKIFLNHDAWLRGWDENSTLIMSDNAKNNRNLNSEWFKTNAQNDNKWYKKAYDYAKIVTDEGGYVLAENYKDNSRNKITSTEAIFVLPLDGAKASHNYLVNKCFVGRGGQAYGYSGTPWNGSCAVPQFIHTYDADDTRLTDTWAIGQQYYFDDKTFPIYEEEQKVSDDDPLRLTKAQYDSDPRHAKFGNSVGYYPLSYTVEVHSINNPGAYDFEGARFQKQEIVPGNRGTYGDDVCFYRLADAMFIKAEALLRIGAAYDGKTEDDAAAWVTQVRQRAFKDNPAKATRTAAQLKGNSVYDYGIRECTTSGSANPYNDFQYDASGNVKSSSFTTYTVDNETTIELGGLLDDLAWEFVGEHHRRQDLIRFMCSDGRNVYNGKTWFCHKNKADVGDWHNNVFPIYTEFLTSNVKLVQNYGFSDSDSAAE